MSISSIFSSLVGLAMLVGCFWFIATLQQKRWRWFSDRFAKANLPAAIATRPVGPVVFSSAAHRELMASDYTTYHAMTLGVHREGLSIAWRGPNLYRNPPFLIPFDRISAAPSRWPDLLFDTVAVSHERLPGCYLIMAKSDIEWAILQGAPMKIAKYV